MRNVRVSLDATKWHELSLRVGVPEDLTDEEVCDLLIDRFDEVIDAASCVEWIEADCELGTDFVIRPLEADDSGALDLVLEED